MYKLLESYKNKLSLINNVNEFDIFIDEFLKVMRNENVDEQIINIIRNKGKYLKNSFSETVTKENMFRAKENLLFYLEGLLNKNINLKSEKLVLYLQNFYLYLEAFGENIPDKRATISIEDLKRIKIKNEYDLQHLLYAVIKPLYTDARKEVTEDSGVGAVRNDIFIPSLNMIIEAKCTRKTMQYKKLIEEMEADIVHYNSKFIYFYVYDREKIIKEKQSFENYFNRKFDGKEVRVFVLQPINL